MSRLGRYLRTVRHLERRQIGWRVVHELRKRLYARTPPLPGWLAQPNGAARIELPPLHPLPPSTTGGLRATAERWRAGQVAYLATTGARDDWRAPTLPRLWRYEHHYHSELPALAAMAAAEPHAGWDDEARRLVDSWRDVSPPGTDVAWDSYPVARRIINWSLAAAIAPALQPLLAPWLDAQVRFLSRHLELHLGGNHLLTDGLALLVGTAVLAEAPDATRRQSMALVETELSLQLLADGGYAERTTQYHALVLRDLLLAIAFARAVERPLSASLGHAAARMADWLRAVVRADGSLPWLNDAAPDATPPVDEVLGLAAGLGLGQVEGGGWLRALFTGVTRPPLPALAVDRELPETGWSLVREAGHELLFEHGPIGPDEQPGHGHADALSYELIWDGLPVVVDTGISTYDIGAVRSAERSARAHAAIAVDGEGADEPWASFRVGGRARVDAERPGRHGPVRRLRGSLVAWRGWRQRRTVWFWPGAALVVVDEVTAAAAARVESYLPLAAGLHLVDGQLRVGGMTLGLVLLRGTLAGSEPGWIGRGFGRREPRDVLVLRGDGAGRCAYALVDAATELVATERGCRLVRGDERYDCDFS